MAVQEGVCGGTGEKSCVLLQKTTLAFCAIPLPVLFPEGRLGLARGQGMGLEGGLSLSCVPPVLWERGKVLLVTLASLGHLSSKALSLGSCNL